MSMMPNQAQVSTSLCSQGPVAQSSLQWVLLGWRTKVDPTRLRSRRRDKAHQKLLQQDRNRFRRIPPRLDDFCAHMPQDLPADNAVRRFWTSPHNRPFTSSSATISLTRDTCSEITTRPMTMTLPSRLLFFARYQKLARGCTAPAGSMSSFAPSLAPTPSRTAPLPTSTRGPCPNYDCTSRSAPPTSF
ncbi:hypothetical protein BJV77DRAFT_106877 [Russula vinacea]|nr:hypothetical protein BJV77DRAFT_106877 [Russula vinacea]